MTSTKEASQRWRDALKADPEKHAAYRQRRRVEYKEYYHNRVKIDLERIATLNERQTEWRDRNRSKYRARARHWYHKHQKHLHENPHDRITFLARVSATAARHRAAKLRATPSWLSEEQHQQITQMYLMAHQLTEESGMPHEVDHIVPLQGRLVRGLHVPWNLQILTRSENASKGNKHG